MPLDVKKVRELMAGRSQMEVAVTAGMKQPSSGTRPAGKSVR